ncbi:MAG TPA: hypothetical protein VHX14_13905 [Thermoanaerobaculia bacterium]|nr:hypothetical protein [Thermoanaerobaculia bacterium]
MKRTYAFLAAVLLLAGCVSSAGQGSNASKITLHLEQAGTGVNAFASPGPVTVQFVLTGTNTTTDPLTLARLEVRSISDGAYSVPPVTRTLNMQLAPGQSQQFPISVRANAHGGRGYSNAPVMLRGAGYLTGPNGHFVEVFTEGILQR